MLPRQRGSLALIIRIGFLGRDTIRAADDARYLGVVVFLCDSFAVMLPRVFLNSHSTCTKSIDSRKSAESMGERTNGQE